MPDDGSVTHWLVEAKAGSDAATQRLWERYFKKLVRLARGKLGGVARRSFDEEDVALSAFDSFHNGIRQGRYPSIQERDDLWRLLVVITARKACDYGQHVRRQKRGGGCVVGETELVAGDSSEAEGLAQFVGLEPTPEFAAILAEQFQALLARMPDVLTRRLAELKFEGYTNEEIAKQLDVTTRTVERKLQLVRTLLKSEAE
ncbi:MAG TPA: ECF-type sigma factor [Pirellulales bacterium]|jgi:DNA-directed RNA polymerase specialized sigma24 family protein|nr:ECF-type sigma factor [Pirellulales bacterium]